MFRTLLLYIALCSCLFCSAQIYILKDHRDSIPPPVLFDTLPVLCDSFFSHLKWMEVRSIKSFVPQSDFLKSTFDTLDISYTSTNVFIKQQHVQKGLEYDYKKILKKAEKRNLHFKRLTKERYDYRYGMDDKGNEFCFVSMYLRRNNKEIVISFIAIRLNKKWFIGDDLKMHIL